MKIKQMREKFGFSQAKLAEMLNTSQQTIGRWETGKAEPNISAMRDLAMIFGISIDFLVGSELASTDTIYPHMIKKDDDVSGYWGNIGLLHPRDKHTRWYPISYQEMKNAYSGVQVSARTDIPIQVQTLNNRVIAFRPQAFDRVWFLDDACDQPVGDWEVGPDDVEGMPSEFYAGLELYLRQSEGLEDWAESTSETYRDIIKSYLEKHSMGQEEVRRKVEYTSIRTVDGRIFEYAADPSDLFGVCFADDPEYGEREASFRLNSEWADFDSFYNWNRIAMVDAPLRPFLEEVNRTYKDGA